jgi:hypothetical protein
MDRAGITRPTFPGQVTEAHHIVESIDPAAYDARVKLADLGIDINSTNNGVFLPKDYHGALHANPNYTNTVAELLVRANTYDEGVQVLDEIRQSILAGTFP